MRWIGVVGVCLLLFLPGQSMAGAAAGVPKGLTLAAAANAQYVMSAVVAAWEQAGGAPVTLVVGSSGKLAVQVRAGAPFDLFVAADSEYPAALHREGLAEPPRVYAVGSLVVWTRRADLVPDAALTVLRDPTIRQIAIANPAVAPYGAAALEALTHAGLLAVVQPKLVLGESVAQVHHYLTTGAVDAVVTARAMTQVPSLQPVGSWVAVAPDSYRPIAQAAAIVRRTRDARAAAAVADCFAFLFTPAARALFTQHGYGVPVGGVLP